MKRYHANIATEGLEVNNEENPYKKKKLTTDEEDTEEARLTALLFGGGALLANSFGKENIQESDNEEESDQESENGGEREESEDQEEEKKAEAKWHDEDDESIVISLQNKSSKLKKSEKEEEITGVDYEQRLRENFEKIQAAPEWAKAAAEEQIDEALSVDILRTTNSLISSKPLRLPSGTLQITKLKDANYKDPTSGFVTQTKFHPTLPILLAAGYDKKLRLFNIDGKENLKLQSVYLDKFPIHSAFFTKGGEEIICTSDKRFFYSYDLTSGEVTMCKSLSKQGEIKYPYAVGTDEYICFSANDSAVLLSSRSKQFITTFKLNSPLKCATFSKDASKLITGTTDGEVYIWDLRSRKCMHRFTDEGSTGVNSIAISPDESILTTISKAGVTNIYDYSSVLGSTDPVPRKSLMNLTTHGSYCKFNHDSQLLGISSDYMHSQIRLVHTGTNTVFSNWPAKDKLSRITEFDFSPHSGYFAMGNEAGRVLLYRLNYFDSA